MKLPIGMDDGLFDRIANGTKHVRGRQTFDTMRVAAAPFSFDTVHAGFDQVPGTARSVMYRGRFR